MSNREDAADILSESMLTAWRKVRSLRTEPEAARMWLFTIARYTLLNERRKHQRSKELAERLRSAIAIAHVVAFSESDPVTLDLRDAIRTLPDDLAEVIRLVHWDGFTLVAIAKLLRVSPSTARRRYERAIRELNALILVSDDTGLS